MKEYTIDAINEEANLIAKHVVESFARFPTRGVPRYVTNSTAIPVVLEENLPQVYKLEYTNTQDPTDVRAYFFRSFEDACEFLDSYDEVSFPIPTIGTWIHSTGIPFLPKLLDLNREWSEDEEGDDVGILASYMTFNEHVNADNITVTEIVNTYTATMPQYSQMVFNDLLSVYSYIQNIIDNIRVLTNFPYALSLFVEIEDNVGRTFFMPFTFYHGQDGHDVTDTIKEFMDEIDAADKADINYDPEVDEPIDELSVVQATVHYLPEYCLAGQYRDLIMAILPVRTTDLNDM